MFGKNNFISLGLSNIDFSSPSFNEALPITEALPTKEQWHQGFIALGNSSPIELRLAETIKWCLPLANALNPKESLRSDKLRPVIANTDSDLLYMPNERLRSISNLLKTRSRLLNQKVSPVSSHEDLKGGKLLAYFPDENVWDGASEVASFEFLDGRDAPAWDTWVGLFKNPSRDFILSYIPQSFIKFVQAGIDVNCMDCIQWLEDTQTNVATELLNKGILR
ncbi:MAG: hypothetical protein HY231_10465 [Acidobacteria bacterium]|nr:hypothetical protein [Acidobacteriota bacterium]